MSEDETAARLAVHEAVCAERWKQASDRLARIEIALAAIVLLLLIGERAACSPRRRTRCGRL